MRTVIAIAAVAALVSGCATSPKTFYADPSAVKDTPLCRTLFDAAKKGQMDFAKDVAAEADRRGLTLEACKSKINTEDAVLLGTLLIGTAVGVGIACQHGCSGGGYSAPQYSRMNDVDCAGGGGNGPYFQHSPVYVGGYDPHGLDGDGDGMGCEAGDPGLRD